MLANFSNLITFSRGSNATVTDASGRLTYAANNLVTNSQDFEAAAWVKLNGGTGSLPVVTANSAVAPDGSTTADTIVFTQGASQTVNDFSLIRQSGFSLSGIASVYLRANSPTTVKISADDVTYTVCNVTTQWQRFFVYAATATRLSFGLRDSGTGTSATVFAWGAQLEAVTYQTTPSPYVSTSVANLLGFSEDFTNAAWTKTRSAIVPGAAQNPINNLWNAQKLMEDTSSNTHIVIRSTTVAASTPYTFSIYLKAAERSFAQVRYENGGFTQFFAANINLSTGAVTTVAFGSPTGTSATATSAGNGWWRVSITTTSSDTTFNAIVFTQAVSGTNSYTGDGNSGIYIYGAQLSNSGSLDPYVPTPGAAPSSTAYYGPRFDYDPVTLAAKGILIEEQRTNLLTLSENIAGAAWFVVNIASRTANTSTSPSGTVTAGTLTDDTTTARHVLYNTITLGSSGVYTFSVYLKQGTGRYVQVQLSAGSSATSIGVIADLLNGTITDTKIGASATNTASSITSFGNGWYRVSVTCQCASGTVYPIIAGSDSATPTYDAFFNPTYTGTGQTRLIWGAQLEAGAFATSYIPTVASQVTRTADLASITGSLFSQWYRQDEGTLVAIATAPNTPQTSAFARVVSANDGSINEYIDISRNSGRARGFVNDGAVSQVSIDASAWNDATTAKLAFAYQLNNFAMSGNGNAAVADTSGTVASPLQLTIGAAYSASSIFNGHIQNITYYPTRLTDSQLQAITK